MSRKIGQVGLCFVLGACLLAGCGNPAEGLSFGGSVNGSTGFAAMGDKLAYARNLENGSVLELLDREKGCLLYTSLASLAEKDGREYILVTLDAPGDHNTEAYNIEDALTLYAACPA